jgi:hypothetical protein
LQFQLLRTTLANQTLNLELLLAAQASILAPRPGASALTPSVWVTLTAHRTVTSLMLNAIAMSLNKSPRRCKRTACLRLSCCASRDSLRPSSLVISPI